MIAPETLAAALRVAQHGAHRAMLATRGDDTAPEGWSDSMLDAGPDIEGQTLPMSPALPARRGAEAQRPGA